jgi:uroporphyrin-III C-methyltransferase/precorrin-2 dehydrogenase/sirohydrochlorin ferrochelatase
MQYFPIFLSLTGRRVLVVGEGEAATRKAEALRRADATVATVARFDLALLDARLLDDCALAIGADAPDADLEALSAAAQARGIPVNIVDRPSLCSYITPSVIDRAPISIAVSSGGAAPVLARLLRARIEAMVPPAFGRLAALADRYKEDIRRRLPDVAQRRRVLERALGGRVADLVLAGEDAAADQELRREIEGGADPAGIVYLVGAGPGAADLLTIRAQRLLGEADVIVHDRLVTTEVLDMARRDADRIEVGKSRAAHSMPQEAINALLVRLGQAGQKVVRLKGGDPLVFGRGGEEAEALAAAGVAFEIVPGVTAALACAAGAGIPLTHRDAARTLTLATGHLVRGALDLDFAVLARGGTLAVYMGLDSLPALRDGLLAAGLDPATPAALIERGGRAEQRVLRGTLDELVAQAPGWATGGPALAMVGAAVGLQVVRRGPGEA